jgi:hypothetical protein
VIVSSSVIGTPSAVPDEPPKLERMSLRTMPLCSRTSGPLEPSPGYGPAVSSGISPVAVVVPADEDEDEEDAPAPQAASPTPTAPILRTPRIRRRLISVPTSKARPWSTSSSAGLDSGRPS